MTKMSRIPVRLCTKCCPSTASNSAAVVPRRVDPNRRRPIRPIISSERVPTTAAENRQPHELVGPKIHSPKAIIHLPTGGWTSKSGPDWKTSRLPLVKSSSGLTFRRQASSYPTFRNE